VMTAGPERGRRRARRYALPLAAIALALAAVGVTGARSEPVADHGPLSGTNTEVEAGVGMRSLALGQTFCYGLVVLRNTSRRQAATLTRVLVHGGRGLRVGPPRVMGPRRSDTIATAATCPAGTKPLPGYVVPPGTGGGADLGVEVLLPITVSREGKSRIDGVSVLYRSGERTYRIDDVTDIVACTYECDARPDGR
jgi:hypothetical protein